MVLMMMKIADALECSGQFSDNQYTHIHVYLQHCYIYIYVHVVSAVMAGWS